MREFAFFQKEQLRGTALKKGKRGVAYFAIKNEIPIIPTAVIGTKGILEKVRSMRRESVKVVFGSPIFTNSGDNIDDITAKTMQEIKKLLPEDY